MPRLHSILLFSSRINENQHEKGLCCGLVHPDTSNVDVPT